LRRQLDFPSSLTSTAVPELSPRRVPRFVADQESRIGRRRQTGRFPYALAGSVPSRASGLHPVGNDMCRYWKLRLYRIAGVRLRAGGGDGQTPLHFASTVEVAEFLLPNGAEIDARDVGHESTPAQYMLRVEQQRHYPRDRQEVARYLVARGCRTDILMAAALGDVDLVRRHLDADAGCIRTSVSQEWFPKQDPRAGGTIYIWKLGAHRTAHSVARDFGHEEVFQLLKERTPEDLKMALACELGDEAVFQEFLSSHPDAAKTLSEQNQRKLPNAAQNNNTKAVRLMLEAGWPVDTPGEMGATALHWAGFNGNAR
jgi:Ankyrin repeat